jgi:hypothetical protein
MFKGRRSSYEELWSTLCGFAKSGGLEMPKRTSAGAWQRAGDHFENIALTGNLSFRGCRDGAIFDLQLNPMKVGRSFRLARKYGGDRFCVIGIPTLCPRDLPSDLKQRAVEAREAITSWLVESEHHFLGRVWRAFYIRPQEKETRPRGASISKSNEIKNRVFLFAVDGNDSAFRQGTIRYADNANCKHSPVSIDEMIQWFMPLGPNREKPSLKLFARLRQGNSSKPTLHSVIS